MDIQESKKLMGMDSELSTTRQLAEGIPITMLIYMMLLAATSPLLTINQIHIFIAFLASGAIIAWIIVIHTLCKSGRYWIDKLKNCPARAIDDEGLDAFEQTVGNHCDKKFGGNGTPSPMLNWMKMRRQIIKPSLLNIHHSRRAGLVISVVSVALLTYSRVVETHLSGVKMLSLALTVPMIILMTMSAIFFLISNNLSKLIANLRVMYVLDMGVVPITDTPSLLDDYMIVSNMTDLELSLLSKLFVTLVPAMPDQALRIFNYIGGEYGRE